MNRLWFSEISIFLRSLGFPKSDWLIRFVPLGTYTSSSRNSRPTAVAALRSVLKVTAS